MNLRQKHISCAIALFLVFSTTQLYVSLSFAAPQPNAGRSEVGVPMPPQSTGSLTTQGNKPILVNGAAAISGATLVSGASIETPDGVGATVNLGILGSLQIGQNAKLTLEFQSGSVGVMVTQGCVTLRTKKGTTGEVDTPQSVIGRTDPARDGIIRMCPDRAPVAAPVAAGGGGLLGIGTAEAISLLILTATFVIVPIATRGKNPSPVTP